MHLNKLPEYLESERLFIKVPKKGLGHVFHNALCESHAQLKQWLPWVNPLPTLEESEKLCQSAHAKFLSHDDYIVFLFLKENNALIGGSGLHNIDWNLRKFEVGYWGRTSYLGKGLITEGVKTLVQFARDHLKANRIYLTTDEKNIKSWKLAERIGFKHEGTLHLDRLDGAGYLRNTKIYAVTAAIQ